MSTLDFQKMTPQEAQAELATIFASGLMPDNKIVARLLGIANPAAVAELKKRSARMLVLPTDPYARCKEFGTYLANEVSRCERFLNGSPVVPGKKLKRPRKPVRENIEGLRERIANLEAGEKRAIAILETGQKDVERAEAYVDAIDNGRPIPFPTFETSIELINSKTLADLEQEVEESDDSGDM